MFLRQSCICFLKSGDSGIKRVKIEQEADWRVGLESESVEKCTTASEQNMASTSAEPAASTSKVVARPVKSGYDELPREMHDMKIRDDKSDTHEDTMKVNTKFSSLSF